MAARASGRFWGSNMASKSFVLTIAVVTALGAATLDAQQATTAKAQESRRFYADDPLWLDNDMRDIAPVAKDELSKSYDFVHNTFAKRAGLGTSAVNVNTLGEVPDSSWFTNRIGVRDMTIDEVLRGPDTIDGPAPGPWEVIGHPTAGITPKFAIQGRQRHRVHDQARSRGHPGARPRRSN